MYRDRTAANPADVEAVLGCMTCLDALGDWDELVGMCDEHWSSLVPDAGGSAIAREAASLATRWRELVRGFQRVWLAWAVRVRCCGRVLPWKRVPDPMSWNRFWLWLISRHERGAIG